MMSLEEIRSNSTKVTHSISEESQTLTHETSNLNEIKTSSLAKRIFTSPVFWGLALSAGTIAFAAVALATPVGIPLVVTISIVAAAALGIAIFTAVNRHRLLYEITLTFCIARNKFDRNWNWYHEIIPEKEGKGSITLGSMPLKSKNHHHELKDYAFLAMTKEPEMRWTTLFSDPLTPEDREIMSPNNHLQISTQDFCPVSAEDLKKAVDWIKDTTEKGQKVYVHCKAGRSRSCAAVVSYMLHEKVIEQTGVKKTDIDNAVEYVKKIRPFVSISTGKRREIERFYENYCI